MAKTIKDTDYLVISARVKALETGLLTAERMEQILDAKSGEDAGKLLQEWGYPQLDPRRPEAMDAALSAVREATLADLAEGTPDARYIDLFKVKYDYHNVKALLKAEAVGTAPDRMLMDMGRVSTAELAEAVRSRELDGLPETLAAAVAEAREVLDTTRDPQLSDIVLDRWCYRDMAALAEETGSAFLRGYVAVQVDAVNLRKGDGLPPGRAAGGGRPRSGCGGKGRLQRGRGPAGALRRHPLPRRRGGRGRGPEGRPPDGV